MRPVLFFCKFPCVLEKSYWYLDFGRLWGCPLAGQSMRAFLCILQFTFVSQIFRNIKFSIIVIVSGLWAPLGMPPDGQHYATCLVFLKTYTFVGNGDGNRIFNNRNEIWTVALPPGPQASRAERRADPSRTEPS